MNYREMRIINGVECCECTACFAWLPASEFYALPNPDSKCHLRSECKACTSARHARDRQRQRLRTAFAGATACLFIALQSFGNPAVEQVAELLPRSEPVNANACVQLARHVEASAGHVGGGSAAALDRSFLGHATNHTGFRIMRFTPVCKGVGLSLPL